MCVIGPNGGGKTTLLRTLLGLVPSLAGEVLLEGRPLASLPRAAVARQLGYVPQGAAAYFAYSVREFVLMGRTAHVGVFSSPTRKDLSVAERALESLGIAALAEKPVTEISGGERQLALVARALAQEPRVLVMDEPTASLDYGNQVRVLGRMRALAEQGIAVLFSSHDPGHAFLAAGRALLLGEGRVLELGAPAEVIREDSLRRLYGVSVRIVQSPDGRNACLPSLGR
ncbi:MAG: ABC transporter ATP-binding protein [Betaproteobacteria bacterium]|nr:ABC transporter ATP-binding protein [Betaproteobacteria bacterium]